LAVGTERRWPEHLAVRSGLAELGVAPEVPRPEPLRLAYPMLRCLPHLLPLERTLPRLLQHLLPLGRSRSLPALAQRLPALRRQALELAEVLAHGALSVRWKRAELLPTLAQLLPLGWRQCLPALESLPRRAALLRCHVEPPVAAIRESLLTLRREALPVAREARQQPLLIGRERRPGNVRAVTRGRRRSTGAADRTGSWGGRLGERRHSRRRERQESCDAHRTNAPRPHCF